MIATAEKKPEAETQVLGIRASGPWVEWLDEAARRTARTRPSLFEAALMQFAKAEGLPSPPPRV